MCFGRSGSYNLTIFYDLLEILILDCFPTLFAIAFLFYIFVTLRTHKY